MIRTALIYFLFDHCLDRLDSRVTSTMVAARKKDVGIFDSCGLVVGAELLWLNYVAPNDMLYHVIDCKVLEIDTYGIKLVGIFEVFHKGIWTEKRKATRIIQAEWILSYQS